MHNLSYELKRSKRKTISVEITRDLKIIVRAPSRMKLSDIEAFLESKREWIESHYNKLSEAMQKDIVKLRESEMDELRKSAKRIVLPRVEYYASLMGVSYNRIAIRLQKTRFGSCSGKGNLNFNALIALMPSEIVDYVIVHELAHIKEMNHSAAFWNEVGTYIPDYKKRRDWLKENGLNYIRMI